MPRTMIPPLPAALGETPGDRFKRFTKAILSVPKTEIETPEQAIGRLEAEKRKIREDDRRRETGEGEATA
jgi:hypothetical protein